MFKHWRAIVGILLFLQPAWQFIKWGLDWAGRIDLITSHLHDFGVQAVLDFIYNPPAWSFLPSVGIGLLLIWWDVRRKEVAELDLNRKLLIGFYLGCAVLCVSVWFAAWYVSIPAVKATPAPIMPPPAPVVTPKPPPPPWVTSEDIEEQRKLGRTLLIYSPREFAGFAAGGQKLDVYESKWIKVDYPIIRLPAIEVIEKKEYYVVYLAVEIAPYTINNRYMAAFFDPKKWADRLLIVRNGSNLTALCQFMGFDRRVVNSYYADVQLGYNCELL
jgi:hypothetical protein